MQVFNRYSYCLNNPLAFTDSSGYFLDGLFDAIGDALNSVGDALSEVFTKEFFTNVLGIALGAIAMSNPVTAALGMSAWASSALVTTTYNAAVSLIDGADIGGIMRSVTMNLLGTMSWGATGGFLQGIGAGVNSGEWFTRTAVHGLVGGGLAEAEGGDFKDGFIAGATGEAVSNIVPYRNDDLTLKTIAERTATSAIVGGTAAAITGGNFANGAKTAAYGELYNGISHASQEYFKYSYTQEQLKKALGTNGIAFGIRPMEISPDGYELDNDYLRSHDLGWYHENVFYTDFAGHMYNLGYFGDKGIAPDSMLKDSVNYKLYRFSHIYHNEPFSYKARYPAGFSASDYHLFTHNCQNYGDTVRDELGITDWRE